MKQWKTTLWKKILVSILLIASILAIHNFSNAVTVKTPVDAAKFFDHGRMMPQNSLAGGSGMMPQYYLSGAERNVTLDDSRLNWLTNQWQATMNGKVVYCADYGAYVRYGYYDSAKHYLRPDGTTIQGVSLDVYDSLGTVRDQLDSIKEIHREKALRNG